MRHLMIRYLHLSGWVLLFSLAFLHVTPPLTAQTEMRFSANDVAFLNLMGDVEGPRGFGTVSDFAPVLPDAALTEMTLAQVLDYQRQIRALGTISSAVGRYQFIYPTLQRLVSEQGIAANLIFDAEVQTYLARFLMHECGFYDPQTDLLTLGNCLAGVWAALPLVSGPRQGQSAYADDGINHAFVSTDQVLRVLQQRFDW